jgi:hypothetical protein
MLGWLGVRSEALTQKQIPYIVSGGLGGLLLVGVGAMLWLSADLRDEWRKLDAIERELARHQAEASPTDRPTVAWRNRSSPAVRAVDPSATRPRSATQPLVPSAEPPRDGQQRGRSNPVGDQREHGRGPPVRRPDRVGERRSSVRPDSGRGERMPSPRRSALHREATAHPPPRCRFLPRGPPSPSRVPRWLVVGSRHGPGTSFRMPDDSGKGCSPSRKRPHPDRGPAAM